jgi:hypothetical protein
LILDAHAELSRGAMPSLALVMETTSPSRRHPASGVFLSAGVLLLLVSLCALLAFLSVPFFAGQDALLVNTAVLSIAAICIIYGGLLIFIGRALQQDRLRAPFRLPSPYLLWGGFFVALGVGQGILLARVASAFLFPIWHVLASLLFPLGVLAYVAPRVDLVSTRSVLAQFTWGGLVTLGLALVLELFIGAVLAVLALLGIAVVLGPAQVTAILQALRQVPTDTQRIIAIVVQQPLSAVIAGGTALLMIVILVPLLEELLKAAGPAILTARRVRDVFAPTRGNVLLWGLAAGAGYAFSENMLNGQNTLNDPGSLTGFWAGAMILRAGTSMMHMIATATVTVGWHEALVARRPIRLPLLVLAAVLAHAIWNTAALLLAGVSAARNAATPLASVSTLLSVLVLGLLALLFVGCVFWLRGLLEWTRHVSEPIQP